MSEKTNFLMRLERALKENGISLDDGQKEKLAAVYLCLVEENKKYNLTAITDPERSAVLHFADSLLPAAYLSHGADIIDVGCGGGFPTLPLAVARPDLTITALDSTEKKVKFISETVKLTGIDNVNPVCARAEEYLGGEGREKYDVAISRGVSGARVLAELCLPGVTVGGIFLAMKGKDGEEEAAAARGAFEKLGCKNVRVEKTTLSGDEDYERTFIIAEKTEKTPDIYPRRYSKIIKAPL